MIIILKFIRKDAIYIFVELNDREYFHYTEKKKLFLTCYKANILPLPTKYKKPKGKKLE